MNFVLDRLKPKFIRRAVNVAALHAAACQPHGEAIVIMVAPIDLCRHLSRAWAVPRSACDQIRRPKSPACPPTCPAASNPSARRRSPGRIPWPACRWFTSMSSWLSQGWPAPCQTCTKRTPRSISRRAISNCRACVPSPYILRMCFGLLRRYRTHRSHPSASDKPVRKTGCALRFARRPCASRDAVAD